MNRKVKDAVKIIAEEFAKEELEVAVGIHKDGLAGESKTLKQWLLECKADYNQVEDFTVGYDLDEIEQAIGDQLVKSFRKQVRDVIARGW